MSGNTIFGKLSPSDDDVPMSSGYYQNPAIDYSGMDSEEIVASLKAQADALVSDSLENVRGFFEDPMAGVTAATAMVGPSSAQSPEVILAVMKGIDRERRAVEKAYEAERLKHRGEDMAEHLRKEGKYASAASLLQATDIQGDFNAKHRNAVNMVDDKVNAMKDPNQAGVFASTRLSEVVKTVGAAPDFGHGWIYHSENGPTKFVGEPKEKMQGWYKMSGPDSVKQIRKFGIPDSNGNKYGAETVVHFIGRNLGAYMQAKASTAALRALRGEPLVPPATEKIDHASTIGSHFPSWEDSTGAGAAPIGSDKSHAMKVAAFDVHEANKKLLTGAVPVEGLFDDSRDSLRRIFGSEPAPGHEFDAPAKDLSTNEMLSRLKKAGDSFNNSIVIAGHTADNSKAVVPIASVFEKHAAMAQTDSAFRNSTKDIGARIESFLAKSAGAKYGDFKPNVDAKGKQIGLKHDLVFGGTTLRSTEMPLGVLEGQMTVGASADDVHKFDVDGYTLRVMKPGIKSVGEEAASNTVSTFRVLRLTPKVGADGKATLSGGSRTLILESGVPAVVGNEFSNLNHVEQHMTASIPTRAGDFKGDAVLSEIAGPNLGGKRARSTVIACHYVPSVEHDSDEDE